MTIRFALLVAVCAVTAGCGRVEAQREGRVAPAILLDRGSFSDGAVYEYRASDSTLCVIATRADATAITCRWK